MKTNIPESVNHIDLVGFAVFAGSSGNKTGIAVRKTEDVYGFANPQQKLNILGLDAEGIVPLFPVPMVAGDIDKMTLGTDFLPVKLPDPESLEKAEKAGKLWMGESIWHKKPGVSKDNFGTGGNSRIGRAMLQLNINSVRKKIRRNLRKCGDYQMQRQIIEGADNKKSAANAITVVVCISLLGGFGTGTVTALLKIIRQEALELKLPVKIILLGMVMGSIEPTDKEVAARNQEMLLRELQARLIGQYTDAGEENVHHQMLCDSIILISNANNNGEFNNLDNLIALAAQYIFYLFHTPMGQAILERMVDIEESWHKDELGGRRCISTYGLSKIHLDLPRVICCVANMQAKMFFSTLLADKKQPDAIKEAELTASTSALTETQTKHLALERLCRLAGLGNADAREYAIAVFQQRRGSRSGFNHCLDLDSASSYTLEIEIPQRIKPQMYRELESFTKGSKSAIENKVLNMLQAPDGLSKATGFLESLSIILVECIKANLKKLELAQNKKKSINDMLGHARDLLNGLKSKFWLWRFLSFSTKKEIRRIFTVFTESAVRNRLEITDRLILANELYPQLQEFVTNQLAQVHSLSEQIMAVSNDISSETVRLRKFNPILIVPVGNELADEQFIDRRFEDVLVQEGGADKAFEKIFGEFTGHYKNLIAFNHCDPDKIKQAILEFCTGMAKRHLCLLNAADVFKQSGDGSKERIAQNIRESNGRLRIAGEADEAIPTIKLIGANDRSVGEEVVKIANEIDAKNGEWRFVEIKDPNTILFFQQRSQISLSRMIADTAKLWQRPQNIQVRSLCGSDPILALMPSASHSQEELHKVIAMGLASGIMTKSDRGYQLCGHNGDSMLLGDCLKGISQKIGEDYPRLVLLYRSFVNGLLNNRGEIIARLELYVKAQASESAELASEIGTDAFVKARETAESLMPYIKRLPLNRQRIN